VTLSTWGMVAALLTFLAGAVYFGRRPDLRTRLIGTAATLLLSVAIAWFAWLAGTQA
jgi:hypothetical protein